MIPNCTRRKNDLLTVPQWFHCRDEAECQETRLLLPCPVCREALSWCCGSYSVATDLLAGWQGTWKLAWKKKINKQLTGCRRKTLACFTVLSWPGGRSELSCGSCERTYRVSIDYAAYSAFYWGTPVKKNDILNIWWLKTGPPGSHIVNHIPLMNKHSS